jgi:hypothetical protein
MIRGNVELYNIAETLTGDLQTVLPPAAWEWLGANPDGERSWRKEEAQGQWLCRLPQTLRTRLNGLAQLSSLCASGGEIRGNLKSPQATLRLRSYQRPSIIQVYQGDFLVSWHVIGTQPTEVVIQPPESLDTLRQISRQRNLPFDAGLTRVMLPWDPPVRLLSIDGDFELPRAGQTPRRKYLAYGSSITHGAVAVVPSGTYAQRTAQLLGVDLLNLGFGGGAQLEPEMADHIASRHDWDFASLEMGVNIPDVGDAEFARRVDGFVDRIVKAHPDKWLFCIDVFTHRLDVSGSDHFAGYRRIVRDKVRAVNRPNVVYVPGELMLASAQGLTADLVHPSPFGMEEIARNLSNLMRTAGVCGDRG